MRSDHLKSHMKKHGDLSSENPEQICKSILESNDIPETSMYRKKPKVNDLHSDGLDETHKPLTVGVDTMQFENIILYDNQEYKRKLDLGKKIYEFIHKNDVYPNSVRPEYKEALDVYMEESVESFHTNVELKPWQNELLMYIKPHDREIIWVVGKDGNEGKIGSKIMLNLCLEHEKW